MNQANKARLLLALSMGIFGTLAPFVRNISVSSAELALYRAVLASLLIGGWLLLTGKKIPFLKIRRSIPLLLFSGVAMGINWILLFEAYKYTTVSAATLSYYFAPCIVTAVCPILFREKLTAKQIVCFVMSTLGIVLITGTVSISGSDTDLIGILFGLGAAVFYATVVLLNKFIRDVDGIHRTLLQFLAAVMTLIPYVALTGGVTLGSMVIKSFSISEDPSEQESGSERKRAPFLTAVMMALVVMKEKLVAPMMTFSLLKISAMLSMTSPF